MCLVVKVKSNAIKNGISRIGIWNVGSTNQGKLDMIKQQMARVNINILGIHKLKWVGLGKFNSDDYYINYCRQKPLRRNGVALIVKKSLKRSTWVQSQKWQNDLSLFPRQTTQHHSNPSLCPNCLYWRNWRRTVLWRPTRPRTKTEKRCHFHHRVLEWKNRMWRDTWSNRQTWLWTTEWNRAKANSFVKRKRWS